MASVPVESSPAESEELGIYIPVAKHSWNRLATPIITVTALVAAARFPSYLGYGPSIRDRLPEPIDMPDHVGNMALTFTILDTAAKTYFGRERNALTEEEYKRKTRKAAIGIGALAVAANVFAEKVGYGSVSTPDNLDFVYGLFGGALAYYANKPRFVSPETTQYILENPNTKDEVKKEVGKLILRRLQKDKSNDPETSSTVKPARKHIAAKKDKNKNRSKMQKNSKRKNNRRKK